MYGMFGKKEGEETVKKLTGNYTYRIGFGNKLILMVEVTYLESSSMGGNIEVDTITEYIDATFLNYQELVRKGFIK